MKNLTFKAAALNNGRPTVNRRSTDGQSQRRYSLTPITKRWKVLMTLVFLFTFAIGNVWAATSTNPATKSYGGKTFLDVAATAANARIKNSDSTLVYNSTYLLKTLNPAWITGTTATDKSDSKSNFSNLPDYGFLAEGSSSGVNTTNEGGYSYIKITNAKEFVIYVTGTNSIAFLGKGNKDNSNKWIGVKVEEIDSEGNATVVADASSNKNYSGSNAITEATTNTASEALVISPNKYYRATVTSGNSSNCQVWQFRFGKSSCETKITTQPSGATIAVGDANPELSIVATNVTSYAWKESSDGTSYDGSSTLATTTDYTPSVNDAVQTKYYYCEVTSSCDGAAVVRSNIVTINVVGAITYYTVTLNPAGGTIADATGWTLNAGNYEKEVAEGTVLTLPTFTKTDRAFKTWRKAGPADVASPVTVDGDLSLTAIWTATIEQVIYSWEGAEGGAIETGGTASSSTDGGSTFNDAQINVKQAETELYCLQINGNNSFGTNLVQITLAGEEKVKTGDKIKYWGFYSKSSNANARPKMRDANGSNASIFDDPNNLPNLYSGGDPAERTFTVPASINTNAVQLTRSQTGSTTWISKLQIIREVQVEEGDLLTVTFNYNDGVTPNATIQVASGQAVAQPANPTWAHHRFNEWQLAGSAYDFSSAVTADITLVANWTQLYTVTYAKGAESATGDAPTQDELAAGEKFTVAANPFAYDGHDFSTWNDGSADVAPGTEYTMGAANVTLTAQWITATTKVTVTYKDGETTLGSEEITINTGNPIGYATYQTRNLATFDGWYSDPDLAEGHKIADISTLTASANVNVYGKWNYQYATSVNIEQWTLDNGKGVSDAQKETQTGALVSLLGTRKFASNIAYDKGNIELDSLNDDPGKTNRNYAYLGLKVKKSGKMLDFRLAKDSYVKVKFGNVAATPKVSINGADYADMELTAGVYSYTATGNDYVSIKTASDGAVVFQQVMINEPIAEVTLPWRVTYDANGGTCATAEAIWSGSALTLPDVTPASEDYTFAGWYDEATGGVLVGAAGASYNATDNVTLFAHFAPVEYAVNYAAGDHGSGDMAAANVGWGTEYTAVANGFTPETGYIFAGWAVSGVDGVSSIAAGGSFTMPKNPVTLTALWEDNSKVAVIVETNVKYESLADAVAAATDGQTIQLLQNNNVTAQVEVAEKAITLDLAGYKIEYTGTSTLPSGVILVHNGASLTIDDSSDPDAGSIVSGEKAYAAIALTKAGDDAANPATLVVNGGTLTGHYYGITGNGSRNNTDITINDGTITGTVGIAIYHPQVGTLTVNNGSLTGEDAAIEMRAGTLVINDGTFTATATVFSCNPNGSGSTTSGAAIAIAQHTTKKDIEVTINGGTFNGVKALNESNPQVNDPAPQVAMAITDGEFNGAVETVDVHEFISGGTYDAPVASENCAPGYVPSAEVAPGVYTVVPKDGVEIIGAVVTGNTDATVTGLYKGTASVKLNNKKIDNGDYYIYVTLKDGYTFEENDVLIVDVNGKSDMPTPALEITTGIGNISGDIWKSFTNDEYTTGENIISLAGIAANQTSIGLKRSANQNAKINGLRVLRPMKPMLTAITIDGRDGVIDEANKTVAVTIPHDADLAALTVVPTIAWNEAAATNSIVVNNGGAWVESPSTNTYKLTDKDGDYTVYTITLTRDVLKHAVKFYDGETLLETLEVEDGTNIAAGDVPADPTKEDYIFQGWAETAGGDVVDVTSFTISAAKNFYAKWVADGAIKLLSGATVNHTNFITGVTADETVEFQGNTVNYAKFSGTVSGVNGVKDLTRVIAYNATTNKTKIQISAHNNSTSGRNILVKGLVEGAAEAVDLATIALGNKEDKVSDWIEFNNAANRTIYIMVSSSAGDVYFTQVKVIESGETPMKQAGEAGYSLNLNKGRFFGTASTDLAFEGLNARLSGDYTALNSGYAKLNSTSMSFTVASAMTLSVTTNNNKTYYVTKGAAGTDNETAKTGVSEFDLTAGTWYITAGSSEVQFTNIAFTAPKCEEPTITPMSNSDLCEGDDFAPLTVSASVSDEGTLHYAWYKEAGADDEAVGTDAASYTPEADGEYYVIVTNRKDGFSDNSATSNTITVKHFAAAVITTAPLNQRGEVDDVVTLTVAATGKNVSYKWYTCDEDGNNAVAIDPAETGTSLNVTITAGLAQWYKVIVTSDCGNAEAKAKVSEFQPTTPANVTNSILWDWTSSAWPASGTAAFTNEASEDYELLADADAIVPNVEGFRSDMLYGKGQYVWRSNNKFFQGTHIKFTSTVAGKVRVNFRSTGSGKTVNVAINGTAAGSRTNSFGWSSYVEVPAGEVEILCSGDGYTRIQQIEFLALAHQRTSGYAAGDLGTVILEDETFIEGANLYELAGLNENGYLAFDEILSGELEAGKPYLFEVTNPSSISFYKPVGADHSDDEIAHKGMIGTFAGTTLYQGSDNYYYFSGRHIWKVNDFTVAIPIPAHRCYVDMDVLQSEGPAQQQAPGRRRVTLGVQGTQVATGIEDVDASEKPVKLLINGQMYILRGEKLFDATGRLVK